MPGRLSLRARSIASWPVRRAHGLICVPLQQAAEREDVAHVVVDHEHLHAAQTAGRIDAQLLEHAAASPAAGRSRLGAGTARLVQQPLRAIRTPLSTMLFASCRSCASSSADSSLPVKTTIGRPAQLRASSWISSSSSKPEMSGRRRSSDDAVEGSSPSAASAVGACADGGDLDVVVGRSARRCSAARSGSSSTTRSSRTRGAAKFLDAVERWPSSASVVGGLVTNAKAPRSRPCWRSSSTVTICTGMCRVRGSCFSWLQHASSRACPGRKMSSEMAVGRCSRARAEAPRCRVCGDDRP